MDQVTVVQQKVKLCINCKHLKDIKCHRPDGISLVTGLPKFSAQYAESERGWDHVGCGKLAKYFELKVEA
jgi:hypothetical protein